MRLAALVATLCIVGCGGGGGGTAAAVTTSIPAGLWVGTVETDATTSINGGVVDSTNDTDAYSETVNDGGLPLMQPGGEVPVKGLVLRYSTADYEATVTIGSVEWSPSNQRLAIRYSNQIEYFVGGLVINGVGSWLYEYSPPNLLEYVGEYNGAGTDTNGAFVETEFVQYAALSQ